jgi:hypothetical protein
MVSVWRRVMPPFESTSKLSSCLRVFQRCTSSAITTAGFTPSPKSPSAASGIGRRSSAVAAATASHQRYVSPDVKRRALAGSAVSRQNLAMAGRECYHCKQWVEEGQEHDCWTTTEAALTQEWPRGDIVSLQLWVTLLWSIYTSTRHALHCVRNN